MLAPFRARISAFCKDDSGAAAFESVIMIPVLIWAYVASFIFFDAFRTYNSSIKATYTIADILSRQTDTVFAYDIEGMASIFEHLVRNRGDVQIRVTQIRYTAATDEHFVDWSYATNGQARLFNADMETMGELFPLMANAERLLLVETFIPFRPHFDLGVDIGSFSNFTFTRPRFAGQVPFDATVTVAPTTS